MVLLKRINRSYYYDFTQKNVLFVSFKIVTMLFGKIKQGDAKAFEGLFREYYPSVCAVARRFVTDEIAAEDIAQEVFINLWEKRALHPEISDLKTFLYVLVKNRCYNYLRDKRPTDDLINLDVADEWLKDHIVEEEAYRLVAKAIKALPSQSSRIMELVAAGKQNAEISEILNISVSTVKTLKYNAIKTLRVSLKDHVFLLFLFFDKK